MKKLPKSFLFLAISGCLCFSSCKKNIPSDVIQPAQMEDILYDYHLAQAAGNEFDGEERYKRDLLIQYVFEKHHITEAEFDSSMVWYTRNMEKLGDIYKGLEQRYEQANKNLATFYQSKKEQKIASGDSISLWNERSMYLLTTSDLTNRLTFNIKTDTTFHQLDRIVWEMQITKLVDKELNLYAGLTIGYKNDSTASIVQQLTESGKVSLTIKADTLPMARLQGFVYSNDSLDRTTPVVLSDITLMRYHASQAELQNLEKIRQQKAEQKDSLKENNQRINKPALPVKADTVQQNKELRRQTPSDLRKQQRRD